MDLVNPFMHSCLCVFIHKEEISTEGPTEPRSHATRGETLISTSLAAAFWESHLDGGVKAT